MSCTIKNKRVFKQLMREIKDRYREDGRRFDVLEMLDCCVQSQSVELWRDYAQRPSRSHNDISSPNSLLSREITGNFGQSAPIQALKALLSS